MVSEDNSAADTNDAIQQLFAEITALLETAHEQAIAGQAANASMTEFAARSWAIRGIATKIRKLSNEIEQMIDAPLD